MKLVKLSIIAFLSVWIVSCSWGPGNLDEIHDQILTIAYKSPEANFANYKTFAVSDSMSVVIDESKKRVKDEQSEKIYKLIVQNLTKLGYTEVEIPDTPDLLVDLGYIQSTKVTVYPNYWSDWDWWWDYGKYPWYPWQPYYPYPMPSIVSSYTTGSLIIDMADVTKVKDKTVPIVWHGIIRGILNEIYTEARLVKAVSEVFTILPPK